MKEKRINSVCIVFILHLRYISAVFMEAHSDALLPLVALLAMRWKIYSSTETTEDYFSKLEWPNVIILFSSHVSFAFSTLSLCGS